ncbi:hypothetical protein FZC83_02035 [Rossellomorea marisflavi]|uniref:Uncharacterized protein n=1 Tax=Rossellomorea marisflavi TaxID=189381 RepID=A0A5D4RYA6_9BACI|nr:hypothetical protein [Rossellomorea marisflavi]TYS56375.1 hypothetical protein FZC83_02035 [Rossellomorea marisflavi]
MTEILRFGRGLFDYYREHVNGNEDISYDQARRKMTRNMRLAFKADSEGYRTQKYMYGSLHFCVNERGIITWIRNRQYSPQGFNIDPVRYIEVSKELGIEDAETYDGLMLRDLQNRLKQKHAWNRYGMVVQDPYEVREA